MPRTIVATKATDGTGGGVSFKGISLGGKSQRAYLAVDLRVIDATTGEIAFVRTIEGEAKGGGVSVGLYRGGFGGNLAQENKTPAGKAIRASLVMITDYLECVMVKQNNCQAEFDASDDRRRVPRTHPSAVLVHTGVNECQGLSGRR